MPENNQILSVESQLVGLPLAGPESFSQQQLDYLKRALGVDETVLWEGTKDATVNTVFDISEPVSNFEYIKIWCGRTPSTNSYDICSIYPYGSSINIHQYYVDNNNNNNNMNIYAARLTVSTTKLTVSKTVVKALGDTQHTSNTSSPLTVIKIVGIHRIAGGN